MDQNVSGPVHPRRHPRREFLKAGLAAFGSLSLPGLFRDCVPRPPSAGQPGSDGGHRRLAARRRQPPGHLRPQARRPLRVPRARSAPLATRTPGLRLGELLPRHARIADRFTILRSMAHTGGGHPAGSLQLLSGDPDPQDKLKPVYPDFMSVAHRLRYGRRRSLPNYVGVNPIVRYDNFTIAGPAYLGEAYAPFAVTGDPNAPNFPRAERRPCRRGRQKQLTERVGLYKSFDTLRRDLDHSGAMEAMDRFEEQALDLLTSPKAGAGVRPEPREPARSATATAAMPGGSNCSWPAGWSRRAWRSSPRR